MRKILQLSIFIFTSLSLVSLETKADTGEMKTIENEKYNWKMKIPKCWELSKSFTQEDLKKRYLLEFDTDKCKKEPERIDGLVVSYNYQSLDYKRMKHLFKAKDIRIGSRHAVAFSSFAGESKKRRNEKFQTIDWYVFIPCQKGYRKLQFRGTISIKNLEIKEETVRNFPTPLLRKVASTFECT